MKKQSIYALMSAIALTGAVGLVSCTSSEDVAEDNPDYKSDTNEVPVNFVFNVSTGNTPASTRMSQANVQATSTDDFRGMEETSLMSFKLADDDKHVASAQVANKLYGLGSILGYDDIGPDSKTTSHRILELSVPVGTNALVFYGKAKKSLNSDDTQGKISYVPSSNLSEISFSLCPRIPAGTSTTEYNETTFANYQALLLAIINTVVKSSFYGHIAYGDGIDIAEADAITWEMYGTTGDPKTLKEKKSTGTIAGGDDDPADNTNTKLICGLGEILSSAFVNLNKFYDTPTATDLRAGSGTAVQKMLVDLYTVINAVAEATPTNNEEAVAQAVGKKIRTNLLKALTAGGGSFLPISEIKDGDHLNLSLGMPTDNNDLTEFPSVFGVPEGTAVLQYDLATNTYSYRTTIPTYNMGGGTNFDLKKYMYPAELCYFGNSPIRKSAVEVDNVNWPEGTTAWDNEASWTNWEGGHVESSTREVAMKYNINYGTSLLKTQVKYGAAILEDNKHAIQDVRNPGSDEANQTFNVETESATKPFTLTGILIGGQNPTVGWNYLANSGTANTMIYDRDVQGGQSAIPFYTAGGAKTDPVYTLVWDNWDSEKDNQDQYPIYVALEFKNNSGKSFWGETNLIPDGGTFYIAGKLDPDYASESTLTALGKTAEQYKVDKSLGITWPTKYALPPYNADGSTKQQRRVFIQDYMTEAVFVIGPTSLQKAMIAIPDLRASQLSLGLSVDLEWSTGLKFDEVILGNN